MLLIGLSAGAAVAVQFAVNAQLKIAAGNPLWAALILFLVGTSGLMITILPQGIPLPSAQAITNAPAWAWIGGLCGAFYVYTAILLLPRVGVAVLAGLIVTGQLLAALVPLRPVSCAGKSCQLAKTHRSRTHYCGIVPYEGEVAGYSAARSLVEGQL